MTILSIVQEINENTVLLGCSSTSCNSCKGSLFCKAKGSTFEVHKPSYMELEIGDVVQVNLPTRKTLITILVNFVPALLLFFLGMFISSSFTANELIQFAFGIIGLCIGFLASALFYKKFKDRFQPRIMKKI